MTMFYFSSRGGDSQRAADSCASDSFGFHGLASSRLPAEGGYGPQRSNHRWNPMLLLATAQGYMGRNGALVRDADRALSCFMCRLRGALANGRAKLGPRGTSFGLRRCPPEAQLSWSRCASCQGGNCGAQRRAIRSVVIVVKGRLGQSRTERQWKFIGVEQADGKYIVATERYRLLCFLLFLLTTEWRGVGSLGELISHLFPDNFSSSMRSGCVGRREALAPGLETHTYLARTYQRNLMRSLNFRRGLSIPITILFGMCCVAVVQDE